MTQPLKESPRIPEEPSDRMIKKLPYEAPCLIVHGRIEDITKGGGPFTSDGPDGPTS